jgi:dihydroorotate dehydrogenase
MSPWLHLPVSLAHKLAPLGTHIYAKLKGSSKTPEWKAFRWQGLYFPNRLGIAGGIDKNAENILDWQRLGAGFIEVGTITPKAQGPNPGTVVDRDLSKSWLWNKLGFPSKGVNFVLKKLKKTHKKRRIPLFANIGKNRKTENDEAHKDYIELIKKLDPYCDAFVINISSPNTKGLRDLLEPMALRRLLGQIQRESQHTKPLLLKLSPDIEETQCLSIINIAIEAGVAGFILTNTLANSDDYFSSHEGGGVSGSALTKKSEEMLKLVGGHLRKRNYKHLIVSVGGVLTPQDVLRRLDLGAHLVQTYSALVFEGPDFFKQVAREAKCH